MKKPTPILLRQAATFILPYKKQMAIALVALIATAGLSLGLIQYVRIIVDNGFVAGSTASLNGAIL